MSLLKETKLENGAWLCELNRPEKLNALSKQLIEEATAYFKSAARSAEKMELRVLLLASTSPRAFCVGADLEERKTMSDEEVVETLDSLRGLTAALEAIPCPTISVLEGAAFGGGLELALCTDLRFASSRATMGLTETRLAIIPGAGGTQRLSRLVGVSKAKELIFSGARLSAKEANAFGLLNHLGDYARDEAIEFAGKIAEGGPVALLAAKEALNFAPYAKNLDEGLDVERKAYLRTLKTEDRIEGLQAFAEKRKANYKGK